jgi:endoglucanase
MVLFRFVATTMASPIQYTGVNLSCAEFGVQNLPGTYNSNYTYPNQTEVDYFSSKGMNIIRLPFRWERLQHSANASLDPAELGRLNTFVSTTTAKGVFVILDPHNFARYYPDPNNFQESAQGLIGSAVSNAVFSNFWFRVADIYRTNNHVVFGLMNEPANLPTEQWLAAANNAIAGIRNAGATNLILVPGNGYTGAWTWDENWYGTPNAQVMTNIVDPGSNFAVEAHQYLDSDGSGTSTNIGYASIGADRLTVFTQWLQTNHLKGFLGEFAVANQTVGGSGLGGPAISNMLAYVEANTDVWLGWTWWAGGPWWGDYMFLLDPVNLGQTHPTDEPAMTVLVNYIPIPQPSLVLGPNQFQFTARTGFVYQPQSSTTLTGGWTNYGAAINGAGQTATVSLSTSGAQGFYRVRVSRAP